MIRFPLLRHRLRYRLRTTPLRDVLVAYRHWGLRPNDVMLASFPKSGSTWLTFMLAQLAWRSGREQKLVDDRYLPGIGKQGRAEKRLPSGGRLIRTHEPYRRDYKQAIYVVRDGRDVAVSLFWHLKRTMRLESEFSEFLAAFLDGGLTGAGAWDQHVAGWLESPAYANGQVLLIRYEDLQDDAARELRRTAEFLELEASSEAIADALDAGSKEAMRGREKATEKLAHLEKGERIPVVRKGVVGDWQNYFSHDDQLAFAAGTQRAMTLLGYNLDPCVT